MFGVDYNYFDKKKGWTRIHAYQDQYNGLVRMFNETIEYAQDIGIFPDAIDGIAFYLNNSLTAVASCNYHKYSDGTLDIGFCFNAEVVKKIPLTKLRETVIHEVAHACSIGDHHGYKWQDCCQTLGRHWGLNQYFYRVEQSAAINAILKEQKLARTKFVVRCPACGATWNRTKSCALTQRPQNWRCGCGWKGLEVTQL